MITRYSGTKTGGFRGIGEGGQARGPIIVPARLRRHFGIEEGSIVIAEQKDEGILIRLAVVVPVEKYTPERKAEFLLSNVTGESDYRRARRTVHKLGIDPDSIPHRRPV